MHKPKTSSGRLLLLIPTLLIFWIVSSPLLAQAHLIGIEAQMVGSYDSSDDSFHPWSHHPHDAMQKPSLGFDYLGRIGFGSTNLGNLALQTRLAWDESSSSNLRLQIYNAYFQAKGSAFDTWIGHHKPAFGLNQGLDNHALLMADNAMSGLVFDRDWGVGLTFDRQDPSLSISLGTGSGMPLETDGSWQASTRLAWGDFSRDNYALGISGTAGKVLHSMGYEIMHNGRKHSLQAVGADLSLRLLNYSLQTDLIYGSYYDQEAYAALIRLSGRFLPYEKLIVDIQAQKQRLLGRDREDYSLGFSWQIDSRLSLRSTYTYRTLEETHQAALQLYYLRPFIF